MPHTGKTMRNLALTNRLRGRPFHDTSKKNDEPAQRKQQTQQEEEEKKTTTTQGTPTSRIKNKYKYIKHKSTEKKKTKINENV